MTKSLQLVLVMPVYNEEKTIHHTIVRWRETLRSHVSDGAYRICVVNDGSTDNTAKEISQVSEGQQDLQIITQKNQGHGCAIKTGYDYALSTNAEWILQIDSDGQCDPSEFSKFWIGRTKARVRMGFRWIRKDGLMRWFVSRVLSFQIFTLSGCWLVDANVPYRLMPRELLRIALDMIPTGHFFFLNILLAVNFKLLNVLEWIPISFLKRNDGVSSVKCMSLLKYAVLLRQELKGLRSSYLHEGYATSWIRRYHFNFLTKFLDGPKLILEIGSGNKIFTRMLQCCGHQVTTIDIEKPADYIVDIKNWQQTNLKASSYDVIVAREVIEHIDCIQDIQEICRPQGLIFLSTPYPSFDWLLYRLECLGINQKRITAHNNLVDLASLPIEAIQIRRLFFISQIGIFRNQNTKLKT